MPSQIKKHRKSEKEPSADRRRSRPVAVRLTHPDRIVYPEPGITKRDLANYYIAVADWILPQVTDRPLVLVRCPAGMNGDCFFQKHPPRGLPAAVERIEIREKTETASYAVIHDLEGLISLVQFGTLEIHAWGARADDVEHPDRLVFDLDPDPAVPWKRVIQAARLLRELLEQGQLKSFVKTTGGKGLHIVAPLARRHTWSEVKQFAQGVADRLATDAPDQYIATMSKAARRGKIFIDYLRNERGATSVVAYSTRAKTGAPVSTPLAWEELSRLKSPQQFTLENLPKRLNSLRRDPWRELPNLHQTISARSRKVIAR